jgi:uncharacterized protein (TIGR03067 family)
MQKLKPIKEASVKIIAFLIAVSGSLVLPQILTPAFAADPALIGVWNGQSMEAGGKPVPAAAAHHMRFTFVGDTLKVRGNFSDDRESTCQTLKTDTSVTPHTLDCKMSDALLLAIYKVQGDTLTFCARHASYNAMGRPTTFSTSPGSHSVLVVFAKQ